MRKRIKTKQLSRSTKQRKALFRGLIISLIQHEEIKTTKAKAKAVRGLVEKLITKGKKGTLHSRRLIQRMVLDRKIANKIVDDLGKRYSGTKGGYTNITPLGNRRGDNAPMVLLSLVKKESKKEESVKKEEKKPQKKSTKSSTKTVEKKTATKKTVTKKATTKTTKKQTKSSSK